MSSLSPNAEDKKAAVKELFLRFAVMYGQLWKGQFKSDEFLNFAKKEWQEGLAGFEDRVIYLAIDACRQQQEMPPTMPKFIELCKSIKRKDSFVRAMPKETYCSPEVAQRFLTQIKNYLNQ